MSKRRPGRDPEMNTKTSADAIVDTKIENEVPVVDVEEGVKAQASSVKSESTTEEEATKVELNFKGSEILRAKFPKQFEVAEKIATDWVQDGRFEGLELGHPLAQYFAAKGLRKAKEIEKKVLESPITEKVAMNVLTTGLKAQEIFNQVKDKIKK